MWPNIPERGLFEIRPSSREDDIQLKLERFSRPEEGPPSVVASVSATLKRGQPTEITIGDIEWRVTASKESDETRE